MRVIENRKSGRVLEEGIRFFFLWLLGGVLTCGQPGVESSLVRVHLNRQFSGVFFGSFFIPQTQVSEVVEFSGVVASREGEVVFYVGQYWPELGKPGTNLAVETSDQERYTGRLIGVDERVAIAVLHCPSVRMRGPGLEKPLEGRLAHLRVANYERTGWKMVPLSLVKRKEQTRLPQWEVQLRPASPRSQALPKEGSFVLSREGKLVGLVTDSKPYPFTREIQVLRVLPAPVILSSLKRIVKEQGNIRSAWLGVIPETTSSGRVRLRSVVSGSPAEQAGLKKGDLILRMDDNELRRVADFIWGIRWKSSGQKVSLVIEREDYLENIVALLTERQDRLPKVAWEIEVPHRWEKGKGVGHRLRVSRKVMSLPLELGFLLDTLTPELVQSVGCPRDCGLLVRSVRANSLARELGFQSGDVLTQVNGCDLSSDTDIEHLLHSQRDETLVIRFLRKGRLHTLELALP